MQRAGFEVAFARLESVHSNLTPEQVLRVFDSGAAAAYLEPSCYEDQPPDDFAPTFRAIALADFKRQAGLDGLVDLVFKRIFLVAQRPGSASAS